jgi:hypothetical protein
VLLLSLVRWAGSSLSAICRGTFTAPAYGLHIRNLGPEWRSWFYLFEQRSTVSSRLDLDHDRSAVVGKRVTVFFSVSIRVKEPVAKGTIAGSHYVDCRERAQFSEEMFRSSQDASSAKKIGLVMLQGKGRWQNRCPIECPLMPYVQGTAISGTYYQKMSSNLPSQSPWGRGDMCACRIERCTVRAGRLGGIFAFRLMDFVRCIRTKWRPPGPTSKCRQGRTGAADTANWQAWQAWGL